MAASLIKALTVLIVLQLVIIVAVLIIDIMILKNQNNAADTTSTANATASFSTITTAFNDTTITSTIDTNTSSLSSTPLIVSSASSTASVTLSAIDTTTTTSTTTTTTTTKTTCTTTLSSNSMIDCYDWRFKNCATSNGIYQIDPGYGLEPFDVYCDMTTDSGGWTVIQRRVDDSLEFWNNTWNEYKDGFNNSIESGNLWLGNDRIHVMSQSNVTLRIEIYGDRYPNNPIPNIYLYGKYNFSISDEMNNYTLYISFPIEGNASHVSDSNGFISNNRMPFSTVDKSSNRYGSQYASSGFGGWWFDSSTDVALNGKYNLSTYGFRWYSRATNIILPNRSEMKIRRQ